MKKAILIHLAALVLYVLAVLFIIGDGGTDQLGRFVIVLGVVVTQLLCTAICAANELYDKKEP